MVPFEIDISFENGTAIAISGDGFTTELALRVSQFDKKFEDVFHLKSKVFSSNVKVMLNFLVF